MVTKGITNMGAISVRYQRPDGGIISGEVVNRLETEILVRKLW